MLAADTAGNIGLIVMASLPERDPSAGRSIVKSSSEPKHRWGAILGPTDFPMALNPESGAIVSANNPPFLSDPSLGWYSGEHDRFQRATALLGERDDLNPEDLMALQQDVVSPEAAALAAQIVELAQSADLSAGQQALVDDLKGWDGSYAADQRAALVFQALQGELANLLFTDRYGAALNEVVLESTLSVAWLGEELRTHTAARSAVLTALGDVAWDLPAEATWGDHHRMRLAHPFAILPLVGRRYVTATWGADGGASTLMKTAGPTGGKAHDVSFGQNARFVTDMADPDATWLCMLGGNDGHIGSEAWDDQVDDWRAGRYLQLPLTPARIETLCPWVSELAPAADH
jgi:penicillin amidase